MISIDFHVFGRLETTEEPHALQIEVDAISAAQLMRLREVEAHHSAAVLRGGEQGVT